MPLASESKTSRVLIIFNGRRYFLRSSGLRWIFTLFGATFLRWYDEFAKSRTVHSAFIESAADSMIRETKDSNESPAPFAAISGKSDNAVIPGNVLTSST